MSLAEYFAEQQPQADLVDRQVDAWYRSPEYAAFAAAQQAERSRLHPLAVQTGGEAAVSAAFGNQ